MKRRRRDLECQSRNDKRQPDQQPHRRPTLDRLEYADKPSGTRKAIYQRRAEEQETRRKRPKNEIFEAGLSRLDAVTTQRGHHVKRQGLQLKPHVECHQVARRNHHHHADRSQCDQQRVLEADQFAPRHVSFAHQKDGRR